MFVLHYRIFTAVCFFLSLTLNIVWCWILFYLFRRGRKGDFEEIFMLLTKKCLSLSRWQWLRSYYSERTFKSRRHLLIHSETSQVSAYHLHTRLLFKLFFFGHFFPAPRTEWTLVECTKGKISLNIKIIERNKIESKSEEAVKIHEEVKNRKKVKEFHVKRFKWWSKWNKKREKWKTSK